MIASIEQGDKYLRMSLASAKNAVAGVSDRARNSCRSPTIVSKATSHGLSTGVSTFSLPTPISGPKRRLLISFTVCFANASFARLRSLPALCRSMLSSSVSTLCNGSGLIESLINSRDCSASNARSCSLYTLTPKWLVSLASIFSCAVALTLFATFFPKSANSPGSTSQSVFTLAEKCAIALASTPTLPMPSFFASTSVVPVPQNGSRIICPLARSNFST